VSPNGWGDPVADPPDDEGLGVRRRRTRRRARVVAVVLALAMVLPTVVATITAIRR